MEHPVAIAASFAETGLRSHATAGCKPPAPGDRHGPWSMTPCALSALDGSQRAVLGSVSGGGAPRGCRRGGPMLRLTSAPRRARVPPAREPGEPRPMQTALYGGVNAAALTAMRPDLSP